MPPPAVKVKLSPEQIVMSELVRVATGSGLTVLVIEADVAVHVPFDITTSTTCPFVREVVVKVVEAPF